MQPARRSVFWITVLGVAAITAVRLAVLYVSPLQLYPDEAQYWWWAQTPDIGYFSKPPLIAWIIRLTTFFFGDREWAIRLAIPLLHAGTALLVFEVARLAYPFDARIALWSAFAYLTAPGISYSSGLASSDPPLLFFWALALMAFLRAAHEPGWRWPVLCGAAIGIGLLAKYAMIYFAIGVAVAAIATPQARKLVLSWRGAVMVAIAASIFAPNIAWNAAHGFSTIAHTEANANWNRAHYNPVHLAAFLAGQFGVFGPLLMAAWLAGLWRIMRCGERTVDESILCALSLPPLVLIAFQAIISEANANWAATAFVAASPLAIAEILRRWPRWTLPGSFLLHGGVFALLCLILVRPAFADRLGLGNVFKRQEGWLQLGERVAAEAARGGYTVVAADNRSILAELLYYARPNRFAMRKWDPNLTSHNHFDMTLRLTAPAPRVLLVLAPEDAAAVLPTFESNRVVATVSTPVGGRQPRVLRLYDARFYRGPQIHG
jgi:4-amino-4-deoxy-L-arabinose transferase-like glycosyltransferase